MPGRAAIAPGSDRSHSPDDAKLWEFLVDTDARLAVCRQSLELFDVVSAPELERCGGAAAIIQELLDEVDLSALPQEPIRDDAYADFQRWATAFAHVTV